MPIGRAVSISRRAKSIVNLNISTRSFFIALYNTNNESSIKIVPLIISEAYPSGVPTASMLRGCSRARNQNPGIFLVCRGHLHPEVWRRRSQARLRRRLCCRERNGCSEWLKSCGKHSRRSKISAGFDAISRVVNLRYAPIRTARARMPGHWCGDAELCASDLGCSHGVIGGPRYRHVKERRTDQADGVRGLIGFRDVIEAVSASDSRGQLSSPARIVFTNSTAYAINNLMRINSVIGRKGSVSIPFGCMPMPQSYLIPFEGYFLDLSAQARPSWRSPRAEDIFPHRAGQ